MEQKPSIILYKELEKKLFDLINNSGLAAFVVLPLLEKMICQLKIIEEKEYKEALEFYEDQLKRQELEKKEEDTSDKTD